jgi:hypothetical protein
MGSRHQVPAVLAEHEVVADVERSSTEKSASIVRMLPTPAVGLPRHVTGKLRLGKIVGPDEFKDRGVFVFWEGFKGVHCDFHLSPFRLTCILRHVRQLVRV